MQNGNDPFITVVTGKPVTPLTANKFKPTGGITLPISMHSAVKIPKCIGSTPRANATGKYIGTVRTNIATPVKNIERIIEIPLMQKENLFCLNLILLPILQSSEANPY